MSKTTLVYPFREASGARQSRGRRAAPLAVQSPPFIESRFGRYEWNVAAEVAQAPSTAALAGMRAGGGGGRCNLRCSAAIHAPRRRCRCVVGEITHR